MSKAFKSMGQSNQFGYKRLIEEDASPSSSSSSSSSASTSTSSSIRKTITKMPTVNIKIWEGNTERTCLTNTDKSSNKNYKTSSFFK